MLFPGKSYKLVHTAHFIDSKTMPERGLSMYSSPFRRRVDSLEKILMLGKTEGRRRREQQRMKWLDGITDSINMS